MMLADLARLGARDIEQTLDSRRIILSSIVGSKSASKAFLYEVYASFSCPANFLFSTRDDKTECVAMFLSI
jgi:hypothetical protein